MMEELVEKTDEKRLPYRWALHYQHKQYWSTYGKIDYATKAPGERERLERRRDELAKENPHLKYWVGNLF